MLSQQSHDRIEPPLGFTAAADVVTISCGHCGCHKIVHINTVVQRMQRNLVYAWSPDPSFPVLVMQYIQCWVGKGQQSQTIG